MNVTTFPLLDFGMDEAFNIPVHHRPSHHANATPITAHRINDFAATDSQNRASRAWPSGQGQIYVVDNYPGLARFAKTILELEGFSTCAFEDPATAWQAFAFAQPRPTLLITDNLGGDTGAIELIRRCRSVEPTLKTLLVDHCLPAGRSNPNQSLVDSLLPIPYCGPTLIQEVKRLCPVASRREACTGARITVRSDAAGPRGPPVGSSP